MLAKDELKQIENDLKLEMISDLKGLKSSEIDLMLRDLKQDGFEAFLKNYQGKDPWFQNNENQALLKAFAEKLNGKVS